MSSLVQIEGIEMKIEQIENTEQLVGKLKSLKVDESKNVIHQKEFDAKPVMESGRVLIGSGYFSATIGLLLTISAVLLVAGEISLGSFSVIAASLLSGGLFLLILGLAFVAGGRALSCLVAIERNTRRING
jgi:hypothetical protein